MGEQAHIGAGSVLRERIAIGHHAVVGAATTVIRAVECGITVVGCPARPLNSA